MLFANAGMWVTNTLGMMLEILNNQTRSGDNRSD